jgi:hypothetical protein
MKLLERLSSESGFGTDLPGMMICFNHSAQRKTLDCPCIQPEEIKDVYENEL